MKHPLSLLSSESIALLSCTRKSYSEKMFLRFGRGKQHAGLLYSHWMRTGSSNGIEDLIEPQAIGLVQEMIAATSLPLFEMSSEISEGETVKYLLKFSDGLECESVLIPMLSGNTLCVSSQVGCKKGCAFCETGKMGLVRNLTVEEIISQVYWARFGLGRSVRNIVFMGMGEPFDNYDAVMSAVAILTSGLEFGPSRITISTSGRVDKIEQMTLEADPALQLAVSINAPTDEIRNRIMPINKQWNMAELKQAMLAYCAHPRRRILAGYVLLSGINDELSHAQELAAYLTHLRVTINVIPYNPQRRDRFSPPSSEKIEAFVQSLRSLGYKVFVRGTKGQKIMAACGQLGNKRKLSPNVSPN